MHKSDTRFAIAAFMVVVIAGAIVASLGCERSPTSSAASSASSSGGDLRAQIAEARDALRGRPAPALTVREWANTEPLTLEDLRGRYVVVNFWGHWCGPCVREMPLLFELHDRFKGEDLVIISIHDASVTSFDDMNARLTETRDSLWDGRDIAMPLAIDSADGGGPDGVRQAAGSGETISAYRVMAFPTTILIDREGRVARWLRNPVDLHPQRFRVLLETDDIDKAFPVEHESLAP